MTATIPLTREQLGTLLKQHDIQPTSQRLHIAEILFSARQHVSADQILVNLRKKNLAAAKATVYNTLNLLVEKGLLKDIVVAPGKVYYDSNLDPHHHFYNLDTGAITDIPASDISFEQLPAVPQGTAAEAVSVTIHLRNSKS